MHGTHYKHSVDTPISFCRDASAHTKTYKSDENKNNNDLIIKQ